ncbi:alkaline phosphatase family protein [Kineosporia babensis]|uniref:Alkaline phosphatase family protein n=1 Tax=Kineosporia babensis TaxID=499548 RepID=A0A9X1NIC0_9ACTN|nr:alkaline phosphatase family protein [Kineosporia babensis]MCD5313638.1 alkaline phosphatase family protein [Kineosporia babensis]
MSRHAVAVAIAEALTAPEFAAIVDLVAYPVENADGQRAVTVHGQHGVVRLHPDERHEVIAGSDPVANTDPLAFLPYDQECADPSPENRRNAYPEPARRLLSFFADADRSPDVVIVHTPSHYFPDTGGHRGEHGSLDVIQSRAPFLLSGAGVAKRGPIEGYARMVDVTPTLLSLAGVPVPDGLDGAAWVVDGTPGRYVVGLLWDGAHCSDLLELAASGELPNVAALLSDGLALTGGAVAEFPSVTLANHTSALTGVGPGRHGILGNVFYDRARGEQINANDESTWHRSAEWLRPEVATVFEMLGARSICVNEAVDRGATWSTMQVIRSLDGGVSNLLPPAEHSAYLGNPEHLADRYFRWATQVDDAGLEQVLGEWADPSGLPDLTWWASVITDAGHHAGGPRSPIARDSLRDADRRLGGFLARLDSLGLREEVTFLLTADHGFETADESVTGSWAPALADVCGQLGVTYRDEGPGFVYLNAR